VAQQFFLSGSQVTGLEVKVQDEYQSSRIKEKIRKKLQTWQNTLPPEIQQPFRVTDWQERNEKLFSALKLEKLVMFIVLMLIVVVASFIILVTMAMLVLEKKGEIAILRTMGVPQYKITRLFIMDGALIGICGAVLGFLGGLFLCFLLSRYHFVELPPQYYVTTLPIVIHWPDIILITLSSIVIAIGATFYPAYNAGQMNSVEILRYE
jgi:lipoprotein-releasing system permease protein